MISLCKYFGIQEINTITARGIEGLKVNQWPNLTGNKIGNKRVKFLIKLNMSKLEYLKLNNWKIIKTA